MFPQNQIHAFASHLFFAWSFQTLKFQVSMLEFTRLEDRQTLKCFSINYRSSFLAPQNVL